MFEATYFGKLIHNLRKEKGITLEQLCYGLCDISLMSRFEKGKAEPNKMLKDMLMERLGETGENYRNYVYKREYDEWKLRQEIIYSILHCNIEKALGLLDHYVEIMDMSDPLKYRFFLMAQAQIKEIDKAPADVISDMLKKSILITFPDFMEKPVNECLLSAGELCLIIEYMHYSGSFSLEECVRINDYIYQSGLDYNSKAKILPQFIYYAWLLFKTDTMKNPKTCEFFLLGCNRVITILKKANRTFFIHELLEMKCDLLRSMMIFRGNTQKTDLESELEKTRVQLEAFNDLYDLNRIPKGTYPICNVLVDHEVYCIGDVIRLRRKTLGWTMANLSEGITSERTVSRLERSETEPQREVVKTIFDKMNMSAEFNHKYVVSESPEDNELYCRVRDLINDGDYDEAERVLNQLGTASFRSKKENEQLFLQMDSFIKLKRGSASDEEKEKFIEDQIKALEITIPYTRAVDAKSKYLTRSEIMILYNILLGSGKMDSASYPVLNALYDYFTNQLIPDECVNLFEIVMCNIANHYWMIDRVKTDEILRSSLSIILAFSRLKEISFLWHGILKSKAAVKDAFDADIYRKCMYECADLAEFAGEYRRCEKYRYEAEKII